MQSSPFLNQSQTVYQKKGACQCGGRDYTMYMPYGRRRCCGRRGDGERDGRPPSDAGGSPCSLTGWQKILGADNIFGRGQWVTGDGERYGRPPPMPAARPSPSTPKKFFCARGKFMRAAASAAAEYIFPSSNVSEGRGTDARLSKGAARPYPSTPKNFFCARGKFMRAAASAAAEYIFPSSNVSDGRGTGAHLSKGAARPYPSTPKNFFCARGKFMRAAASAAAEYIFPSSNVSDGRGTGAHLSKGAARPYLCCSTYKNFGCG